MSQKGRVDLEEYAGPGRRPMRYVGGRAPDIWDYRLGRRVRLPEIVEIIRGGDEVVILEWPSCTDRTAKCLMEYLARYEPINAKVAQQYIRKGPGWLERMLEIFKDTV